MDNNTMVAVTPEDYALAETVVHASNIVSHDGYYEVDIDRAAQAIARHQSGRTGAGEAAFKAGWDACWCRKPNAPFERDGGRQTVWEKYRAALSQSTAGEDVT